MDRQPTLMVDSRQMSMAETRSKIEGLLFDGKMPTDKFERAARSSFMDCVMELMEDGQFVKL